MTRPTYIYLLFKETPPADNECETVRLFLGAFTDKREALEWRGQLSFTEMKLYRCYDGGAFRAGWNITDMELID